MISGPELRILFELAQEYRLVIRSLKMGPLDRNGEQTLERYELREAAISNAIEHLKSPLTIEREPKPFVDDLPRSLVVTEEHHFGMNPEEYDRK